MEPSTPNVRCQGVVGRCQARRGPLAEGSTARRVVSGDAAAGVACLEIILALPGVKAGVVAMVRGTFRVGSRSVVGATCFTLPAGDRQGARPASRLAWAELAGSARRAIR